VAAVWCLLAACHSGITRCGCCLVSSVDGRALVVTNRFYLHTKKPLAVLGFIRQNGARLEGCLL
jgi:hypothetical protein